MMREGQQRSPVEAVPFLLFAVAAGGSWGRRMRREREVEEGQDRGKAGRA